MTNLIKSKLVVKINPEWPFLFFSGCLNLNMIKWYQMLILFITTNCQSLVQQQCMIFWGNNLLDLAQKSSSNYFAPFTNSNYHFRELSQKNLFYYKKMDSSNMGFDDDISLTEYIKENIKRPFFFHQHHFYTNFTKWVKESMLASFDTYFHSFISIQILSKIYGP